MENGLLGSPLQTVNNAVMFRTSGFEYGGKHTEENSLYAWFDKSAVNSEYLGIMSIFANRFRKHIPLISATELSNNVMYVKGLGAILGFSLPYQISLPITLENVMSGISQAGIAGNKVKLVLSTNTYTYGDVITYDLRDGIQLRISTDDVNDPIVPYGSGWLYTLTIAERNSHDKWVPQYAFAPGQEWVKIDNPSGEFDTQRTTLTGEGFGLAHYQFELGNATRGVHTWITQNADILELDGGNRSAENAAFWGVQNSAKEIMMLMNTYVDKLSGQTKPDIKTARWTPMIIPKLYLELYKMEERSLMYSKGAEYVDAAGKKFTSGIGLWHQWKSGNHFEYTDVNQLLSLVKNISLELHQGSSLPIDQREFELEVASGAYNALQKQFRDEFNLYNQFPVFAKDIPGMLTGDVNGLMFQAPRFSGFLWPEVGWIKLKHNPALDFTHDGSGMRKQSSIFGAFDEASYTVIIKDVTQGVTNRTDVGFEYTVKEGFNNGANNVLIKPKNYKEPITSHMLGTHIPDVLKAYYGVGNNGHLASSSKKGFGLYIDNASQAWCKDVTRVVIIEKVDNAKYYY